MEEKQKLTEKLSFRLTGAELDFLAITAHQRSAPRKQVKPNMIVRELIAEAMKKSQSEVREAA